MLRSSGIDRVIAVPLPFILDNHVRACTCVVLGNNPGDEPYRRSSPIHY